VLLIKGGKNDNVQIDLAAGARPSIFEDRKLATQQLLVNAGKGAGFERAGLRVMRCGYSQDGGCQQKSVPHAGGMIAEAGLGGSREQ
jgi:hypothetical protein